MFMVAFYWYCIGAVLHVNTDAVRFNVNFLIAHTVYVAHSSVSMLIIMSAVSYLSMTGIDDLPQVFKALHDLVHWQFLGLELGILYNTLAQIRHNNKGIIQDCKRDMLVFWLRQDHNVMMVAPSWLFLKEALRNVGENELADAIQTDGESSRL